MGKSIKAVFPSYTFNNVDAMADGGIYINKIRRDCVVLTVHGEDYSVVKAALADPTLTIVSVNDDGKTEEFDWSAYSIVGDIIIHNNGDIDIQLGKMTSEEITINQLMQENAELLFTSLTGEEY